MIIHSYTLDTEAKVKEQYGGTAWSQITSRFLYGSNSAGTTGGNNNAIVPYHNHTFSDGKAASNGTHYHNGPGGIQFVYAGKSGSQYNIGSSGTLFGGADIQYVTADGGAHTHTVSGTISYAGSNGNTTNANMPAYITCYIWRRTS